MKSIPRIQSAEPLEPFCLRVVWTDGSEGVVDLAPHFEANRKFFVPLLEEPGLWEAMELDELAYHVAWGEGMEVPTTLLRRLHLEQTGEAMPQGAFKAWRRRLGLTQQEAADVLGVSLRMVQYFEHGDRPISRTIRLATIGAEQELGRTPRPLTPSA
jgi:DNA-binding XRE family transcriptional regulator